MDYTAVRMPIFEPNTSNRDVTVTVLLPVLNFQRKLVIPIFPLLLAVLEFYGTASRYMRIVPMGLLLAVLEIYGTASRYMRIEQCTLIFQQTHHKRVWQARVSL